MEANVSPTERGTGPMEELNSCTGVCPVLLLMPRQLPLLNKRSGKVQDLDMAVSVLDPFLFYFQIRKIR